MLKNADTQEISFYIDTEKSKFLITEETDQMSLLRHYHSLDNYGDVIESVQKEILELLGDPMIGGEHEEIMVLEGNFIDLEKVLQQIGEQQTQLLDLIRLQ